LRREEWVNLFALGEQTTRILRTLHQELGSTPVLLASKIGSPADATAALANSERVDPKAA
jgi:hypothetical protein